MADRQDSDAAASMPPPEWLASEWSTLCDILGTSDPEEVVPRVRTLKENMDRIDETATPDESFVTISEVEEVFREMHVRLQKLRERNAQLVEQLEGQDEEGVETAFKELHRETEELLEALGVTSVDEGKQRVRSMNRQLESLYHEKETLVEAGFTSAAEALEEIDTIREQASKETSGPDTSVFHAATAIRNVIGVSTIGEAENLVASIREVHDALADLDASGESASTPSGLEDPTDLAGVVENMNAQVKTLQEAQERKAQEREAMQSTAIPEDVANVLGVKDVDDARRLAEMVQSLGNRVRTFHAERERISEQTGVQSADGVLEMIASMEEQLVDLYELQSASLPPEVGEILGVADEDDARSLESAVRSMGERLSEYQSEQKQISDETGLQSADGVVDMISSMEEQLVDLYDEVSTGLSEEVRDTLGVESEEEVHELASAVRSMSRRLSRYRSERERMSGEIGVDDAEDVLDMVRSMEEQLVELYTFTQEALSPTVGRILGIQNEDEARDLERSIRSMSKRLSRYRSERDRISEEYGVDDAAGVLSLVGSMEDQLVDLYKTMDQHLTEAEEKASQVDREAAQTSSAVGRVLGVESVDEAEELANLVQDMTNQLERLTVEQEKLDQAGLSADQAIGMIDTMEEQLVDLYQDRASGRDEDVERDGESVTDASIPDDLSPREGGDPGTSVVDETESEVLEILGVGTPEEAQQLAGLVRSMSDQLERLTNEQERLVDAGLTAKSALQMIDSMEEQLVDLYEDREADRQAAEEYDQVQAILGVSTPEEARELSGLVTQTYEQMLALQEEKEEILSETDASSSRDVLAMIRSMEEQLVDLYQEREETAAAADELDAIQEELGIRSAEGAREIAEMARSMNEQISGFENQLDALSDIGVGTVEDAAVLVDSMSQQLEEMYREREATTLRASSLEEGQDTFQQLEALYAERERLERELGVTSADDVIEMVEGLATQLDDLYRDRETSGGVDEDMQEIIRDHASDEDAEAMLESMEQQLRDLYSEKKRLVEMGFTTADEAAERIQTLEAKRNDLAQSAAACRERFERLERELGVSGVSGVLEYVDTLTSRQPSSGDGAGTQTEPSPGTQPAPNVPPQSAGEHPGFFIDAAPGFVPDETLGRLEQLTGSQMDELPFGIVRLGETGTVEFVNEAGLSLPGLDERDNKTTIIGKNFFFDLAPSTNNNLFFGRFKEGLNQGSMDARFPYTFISPGQGPTVLIVHLHSKPNTDVQWLLFESM